MSQKIGYAAEEEARLFLVQQGLRFVAGNYRCRMGEIDLIMRDKNDLVFVEVRHRTSSHYGSAIESVTYRKRQKLIKTALLYMSMHQLHDRQPVRFDVIGIEGKPPKMVWIKNAFGLDF